MGPLTAGRVLRRSLLAVGAAVVVALVPSAAQRARVLYRDHTLRSVPRPVDVLLITLDTTRADRLGSYGYPGNPTPNLDRVAHEGVRFARVYSPAPLTLPAHASLLTGLTPVRHHLHDNGRGMLGEEPPTLAEQFVAAGYRTGAFVSAFVLDRRFGLARGFMTYEDDLTSGVGRSDDLAIRAGVTVDRVISWIAQRDTRPLFAWVHLYDPHSPYDPPGPFAQRYKDHPYVGEIAYMDQEIGRLLDAIAKRGRPTIIAAIGDHGEGLGEHGELTHSYFIYEGTQHVPFLLSLRGHVPAGTVVQPVVRLIDVMPTLLDLAGLPRPADLEGRSLVTLITGASSREPGPAYLESFHPRFYWGAHELLGLRSGKWLFIDSPEPELYDVDADARQQKNLVGVERSNAAALRTQLDELAKALKPAGAPAPGVDPETAGRLRALGYVSGGTRSGSAGQLPDAKHNAPLLIGYTEARDALAAGEAQQAVEIARATLTHNPRSIAVRRLIAEAFQALQRWQEALDLFEELSREDPEEDTFLVGRGVCQMRLGRRADALALLSDAGVRRPASASIQEALGTALFDTGRFAEAEPALRRAATLAPHSLRPRLLLGFAQARLQRPHDASATLREVIETAPRTPEARDAARRLTALGGMLLDGGNFAEARLAFRSVLEAGVSDETTYSNLALACRRLGRSAESRDAIQAGLRELPDSALLHYRAGRLQQEIGRIADAEAEYRRAIHAEPRHAAAWAALGALLESAGRLPESIDAYQQLLRVDPTSKEGRAARDALARLRMHP